MIGRVQAAYSHNFRLLFQSQRRFQLKVGQHFNSVPHRISAVHIGLLQTLHNLLSELSIGASFVACCQHCAMTAASQVDIQLDNK